MIITISIVAIVASLRITITNPDAKTKLEGSEGVTGCGSEREASVYREGFNCCLYRALIVLAESVASQEKSMPACPGNQLDLPNEQLRALYI